MTEILLLDVTEGVILPGIFKLSGLYALNCGFREILFIALIFFRFGFEMSPPWTARSVRHVAAAPRTTFSHDLGRQIWTYRKSEGGYASVWSLATYLPTT